VEGLVRELSFLSKARATKGLHPKCKSKLETKINPPLHTERKVSCLKSHKWMFFPDKSMDLLSEFALFS
jgi:hypothetical protein